MHLVRQVIGRMKGTVEEVLKKKEKLAEEVRKGKVTGVSTTPLDAVMDRRRGEGKGGRGGERRCAKCSEEQGVLVLQKTCGGDKFTKGNGPHTKQEYIRATSGDAAVERAKADKHRLEQELLKHQKKLQELEAAVAAKKAQESEALPFVPVAAPLGLPPRNDGIRAATAVTLTWLHTGVGLDRKQVHASIGSFVCNAVTGSVGRLVRMGAGTKPGEGTYEEYWAVDEKEVPADTANAARRSRGGVGDLQLLGPDGVFVWYGAHHCFPVQPAAGQSPPPQRWSL